MIGEAADELNGRSLKSPAIQCGEVAEWLKAAVC